MVKCDDCLHVVAKKKHQDLISALLASDRECWLGLLIIVKVPLVLFGDEQYHRGQGCGRQRLPVQLPASARYLYR